MKRKKKTTIQEKLQRLFNDADSQYFIVVNDFFAILTLISILAITLETIEGLASYKRLFAVVEVAIALCFFFEYIGRIIATKKATKYIFSFFGVIDLIAILPTFFGIANLTFLKSARLLRLLRFLRMIRLAKILRLKKVHSDIESHGQDKLFWLTVQIYTLTLFSVVLISATLIWSFEGGREVFENIPLAMLWSGKVLMGGVPQAMPQTILGEFVTIGTRFMGLLLFGLLINIAGGSIKRLLLGKERR